MFRDRNHMRALTLLLGLHRVSPAFLDLPFTP
jgi:hypothetical protein